MRTKFNAITGKLDLVGEPPIDLYADHVLHVDGIEYDSVSAALQDIAIGRYGVPTSSNRLLILLDAGTHLINAPVILPNYVSLSGRGVEATVLQANAGYGGDLVYLAYGSTITDLQISGNLIGVSPDNSYGVYNNASNVTPTLNDYSPRIENCLIKNCIWGVYSPANTLPMWIVNTDIYDCSTAVEAAIDAGAVYATSVYVTVFTIPERTSGVYGFYLNNNKTTNTIERCEAEDVGTGITLLGATQVKGFANKWTQNTVNVFVANNSLYDTNADVFVDDAVTTYDVQQFTATAGVKLQSVTYNPSKILVTTGGSGNIRIVGTFNQNAFADQFRFDGSTPTIVFRDRDLVVPDGLWALRAEDDEIGVIKSTGVGSFDSFIKPFNLTRAGYVGTRQVSRYVEYITDCLYATEDGWSVDTGTSSTFNHAATVEVGRIGVRTASVGALVGARARLRLVETATQFNTMSFGYGATVLNTSFRMNNIPSQDTAQWNAYFGHTNSQTALGTQYLVVGLGYRLAGSSFGANLDNFYLASTNASLVTNIDTRITAIIGRWYNMRLEVNAGGTEAKLFTGFQFTGNITSGTNTINTIGTTTNFVVGMPIRGRTAAGANLFPPNTTVTSIVNSTTVTVSANALTSATTGVFRVDNPPMRYFLGTTTSGSATITNVPSTSIARMAVNQYIAGSGIPEGAYIVSLGANSVTINVNATLSFINQTLQHGGGLTLTSNIPPATGNNNLHPSAGMFKFGILSATTQTSDWDYISYFQEFTTAR